MRKDAYILIAVSQTHQKDAAITLIANHTYLEGEVKKVYTYLKTSAGIFSGAFCDNYDLFDESKHTEIFPVPVEDVESLWNNGYLPNTYEVTDQLGIDREKFCAKRQNLTMKALHGQIDDITKTSAIFSRKI